VAIANDPVNGARGLQLFEKGGLITLKPGVGDDATVDDIVANPKHLRFLELEAAQLPRALDDVAVAQVSLSYLWMSGGDPDSALVSDGASNPHYALNFVVRADRKDDPRILRFVGLYRSPEVKAFALQHFGKFITPVW
jgi:D-methionine transport system substrate-binding protein